MYCLLQCITCSLSCIICLLHCINSVMLHYFNAIHTVGLFSKVYRKYIGSTSYSFEVCIYYTEVSVEDSDLLYWSTVNTDDTGQSTSIWIQNTFYINTIINYIFLTETVRYRVSLHLNSLSKICRCNVLLPWWTELKWVKCWWKTVGWAAQLQVD